jgi:hypothetical protein
MGCMPVIARAAVCKELCVFATEFTPFGIFPQELWLTVFSRRLSRIQKCVGRTGRGGRNEAEMPKCLTIISRKRRARHVELSQPNLSFASK